MQRCYNVRRHPVVVNNGQNGVKCLKKVIFGHH